MSDSNSGMTALVAVVAIIAILVVGYFAVQMFVNQQNDNSTIKIDLNTTGGDAE